MIPAFSPFLALRYLWRRPIMLLGIAGVTFSVWALLVVDGVFSGFVNDIRTNVHRATPDLLVTDLPRETSFEALRGVIEPDDDVVGIAPHLRHYGLLQPRRQLEIGVSTSAVNFEGMSMDSGFALLVGIDPLLEPNVVPIDEWLDRGPASIRHRWPQIPKPRSVVFEEPDPDRRAYLLLPDELEWRARRRAGLPHTPTPEEHRSQWPGVLVGFPRAASMPQLRIGDPIDLVTANVRRKGSGTEVSTRRIPVALAGYFATGHRLFDMNAVLMPIETLRTLLGHDISNSDSIDLVTDVALRLRPGLGPDEIRACQRRLRDAVTAALPPGSEPCSVLDWQEQNSVFLRAVDQEHSMMQFVLFVVMLIAGFVIYAMLHMMVLQKVKDIGILAAIGGAPGGIGAVFVTCGLVVGGTGALLGSLLGWLSVRHLNDVNDWLAANWHVSLFPPNLFDLPVVPVHLEPSWIAKVAVGALLLALATALIPARKAARMNPVTALSYE